MATSWREAADLAKEISKKIQNYLEFDRSELAKSNSWPPLATRPAWNLRRGHFINSIIYYYCILPRPAPRGPGRGGGRSQLEAASIAKSFLFTSKF